MPDMTEKESSIIISLPHMVDLALGSPEVGAVNFNVLHSLLHVLIQQVKLRKTQVEFRGPDCDRIRAILQTAPVSPTLKLSEYTIKPEESSANLAKKASRHEKATSSKEEKEEKEEKESIVLVQQQQGGEKGKVVEKTVDKPKKRVSKDELNKVEKKVSDLEKQVSELTSLPSNEELIARSRSGSSTKPVGDMWQLMNLTKRVDAAEDGINKLTALVEDLAKDTVGGHPPENKGTAKAPGIFERLDTLEAQVAALEGGAVLPAGEKAGTAGTAGAAGSHGASGTSGAAGTSGATGTSGAAGTSRPAGTSGATGAAGVAGAPGAKGAGGAMGTTDEIIVAIRNELSQVRRDVDTIGSQIQQVTEVTEKIPFDTFMDGIKEIDDLRTRFEEFAEIMKEKGGSRAEDQEQGRIQELEEKLNEYAGQVEGIDHTMNNQMDTLQQQISELERELGEILERVNTGTPMGDSFSQDFTGLSELYNKIQILQGDMEYLNQTATRLMDDREERQLHIEALLEQVDALKSIKADREDLEEALADKADQNAVNRKVSHDQFDAACDDLSRGLEEALSKLTQQETLWQQALDDIQREIENKLDKIEISPLKDFVNSKLKALQERLKVIANMRRESEAAGTKLRILRNVNCISCDTAVVMKTQEDIPSIPAPQPLPPSHSMRPYLTYELDQVRKQQRRPPGKDMIAMEELERGRGREPYTREVKSVDHLCNRYCGGSHTVTTPHQRVARMGHFLTQWGPEAIQLTETAVRGTDGFTYRGSEMPPSPASTTVGKGEPVQPQKAPSLVGKRPSSAMAVPSKRLSSTIRPPSSGKISAPGSARELGEAGSLQKVSSKTAPKPSVQKVASVATPKGSVQKVVSGMTPKGSVQKVATPKGSAQKVASSTTPRRSAQKVASSTTPRGSALKVASSTTPRGSALKVASSTTPRRSAHKVTSSTTPKGSAQKVVGSAVEVAGGEAEEAPGEQAPPEEGATPTEGEEAVPTGEEGEGAGEEAPPAEEGAEEAAPAEEAPTEVAPTEEAPAEEEPAEEGPTEEAPPDEETTAEEQAEEAPVEED